MAQICIKDGGNCCPAGVYRGACCTVARSRPPPARTDYNFWNAIFLSAYSAPYYRERPLAHVGIFRRRYRVFDYIPLLYSLRALWLCLQHCDPLALLQLHGSNVLDVVRALKAHFIKGLNSSTIQRTRRRG